MAIQLAGNGGVIQDVDTAFRAGRVSLRPQDSLNWTSINQLFTLTTNATGATIASLRYTGTGLLLLRRVGIGVVQTAGFTTAQSVYFAGYIARNFTASDTGATTVSLFGTTNGKHRSTQANISSGDIRVANGATSITAGTRTLDANPFGQTAFWGPTTANTAVPSSIDNMYRAYEMDYPITLANNEGLVILNGVTLGAGGTFQVFLNIELAEVSSTQFSG